MSEEISLAKSPHRTLRRRKQLEKDLEHVTSEMYRRNRELAETNQTLSLLHAIDAIVLESSSSLKNVCEGITKVVGDATDYPMIALLTCSDDAPSGLSLSGFSVKGESSDHDYGLKRTPLLDFDFHTVMPADTNSRLVSLVGLSLAEIAACLGCSQIAARHIRARLPLKSLYLVKLIARERVVGVLVAGFFSDVDTVTFADTRPLDRLSQPIGLALDNHLLFEENRRVVRQLQRSNVKLKELDETKDDFVSMASHQLRTPLTSIKGYLSMVLDGDAGKLTPMEQQMLTQAFISSQRMVYLIADLLNVSRLKTGKFVIDAHPADLSSIIEEELRQLKETAAIHKLKLTYVKPKAFPMLNLDETKIRQVVMNFIDNAIYYTPEGGHITIELVDKPAAVELRVIDNGIGVPRSEQHHLFTKFYRAGNARKARPDGTGLGLFMAKKVIMGHEGVVLFDSKEGQGSSFGFTLSKSKLAVPEPPSKIRKLS